MKTTIKTETLKKALKTAKIYASTKNPPKVLASVKITSTEKGVTLESSDLARRIVTTCEAVTTEAGEALLTSEAVKTIEAAKSEEITIEASGEKVTISHGLVSADFTSENIEDFPPCFSKKSPLFSCSGKDFTKLARVAPFIEKDGGRYALNGVCIDFQYTGKCYAIATDGRRMGVQEIEISEHNEKNCTILFPADLKTLAKVFGKSEKITVYSSEKSGIIYHFSDGVTSVSVESLIGLFPDWKTGMAQVGRVGDKKAAFPAEELAWLYELKNTITEKDPGVFVRQLPGVPFLAVTTQTREKEVYLNPDFCEAFETCKINLNFLLDMVKICGKEAVTMQYRDAKSGFKFSAESGFSYLVMPMHGETATQATKRLNAKIMECRSEAGRLAERIQLLENQHTEAVQKEDRTAAEKIRKEIRTAKGNLEYNEREAEKAETEITRFFNAVKKEAEDAIKDAEKAEYLKKEWGEKTITEPENAPAKKTAKKAPKKAPTLDASTPAADDATPTEKAHEKQAEKPLQADQEKQPEPVKSTEKEPEPEPVKKAEPERKEEKPEPKPEEEKPFEIGTYTTKKGKVKTAIKFNVTPRPEWVESLKKAYYWEYNGTWNGSPRKLPEIFKH